MTRTITVDVNVEYTANTGYRFEVSWEDDEIEGDEPTDEELLAMVREQCEREPGDARYDEPADELDFSYEIVADQRG